MLMPFYFLAFLAGLIIGSFLNVCIYRLPLARSVVAPRSHCPFCGRTIKWRDNIPLLSYLLLKGKCRECRRPIPLRYFIVEFLTGLAAAWIYVQDGLTLAGLANFIFACALITVAFIDIEHMEVPDIITLPGLALAMVMRGVIAISTGTALTGALADSVLGILAGGGSMFLLGWLGEMIFKKEALGGGDVKLMAMIGAFLGWQIVLLAFFIAPVFGSVGGLVLKSRRRVEHIAYAPYLCAAAFIGLFWGDVILEYIFWGYGI